MPARSLFALLALASFALAQEDFHDQDLRSRDLSTVNLAGANLEGANLAGVHLSMRDLSGANLKNADLTGTHLDGADLTRADLRGALITSADFRGTVFDSSKLDELDFTQVMSHRGAKFRFASMHGVKGLTDITDCDFSGADLTGAYLPDARDWGERTTLWTAAQYDRSTKWPKGFDPVAAGAMEQAPPANVPPKDLHELGSDHADMRGKDLEGADLREASFNTTDFRGANLRGAILRGANLTQADLRDADLTGADLRDAKLSNTKVQGANLSGVNLEGTNIKAGLLLDQTSLKGANLRNTRGLDRFTGSDLREVDLRGASLPSARNWGSVPARFQGAQYNADTIWPRDFDPNAAGAKLVDGQTPLEQIEVPIPAPRDACPVGSGKDLHGNPYRDEALANENLRAANLRGASLFGVNASNRDLRFADLRDADLGSAQLDLADLTGADLRGAKLTDAHLADTQLSHANLEGVDFRGVWGMNGASLKCANLRGVVGWPPTPSDLDLREADLRGANMAGPPHDCWYGSRMRGAKYDDTTKWPKGIDLAILGVVKVGPDGVANGPVDGKTPPTGVPPRMLAPEKPKGAPTEEVVKRLCEQAFITMWVREWEKVAAVKGSNDFTVTMDVDELRFSYDYKSMTFEPVRTVDVPQTGERGRQVYGVRVVCNVTAEGPDGSIFSSDKPIDRTVYFYQVAGDWKLTANREGYEPPPQQK